jgi:hypothetical protein
MIERPHQKWWGFFMSTRSDLAGEAECCLAKHYTNLAKQYPPDLRGKMILNKTLTIIS